MTHYVYKPWKDEKDAENVLFASIHGYGKLANNVESREEGKVAFFWGEQLRREVLPRLLEFRPDLIFLSSGEKDGRC